MSNCIDCVTFCKHAVILIFDSYNKNVKFHHIYFIIFIFVLSKCIVARYIDICVCVCVAIQGYDPAGLILWL